MRHVTHERAMAHSRRVLTHIIRMSPVTNERAMTHPGRVITQINVSRHI